MNERTDNVSTDNERNLEWELKLAREVRSLDREMQPSRNLWEGIERKIQDYPQPKKTQTELPWMRFGMAASVLMAFSAMVFSLLGYQGATSPETAFASFDRAGGNTLDVMQVEYQKNRGPLVEQFTKANRDLGPATLEELYRNIEIMAKARVEIEAQVRQDPTNRRLVEQLMRIHEQELALLKQDFSQPSRSM